MCPRNVQKFLFISLASILGQLVQNPLRICHKFIGFSEFLETNRTQSWAIDFQIKCSSPLPTATLPSFNTKILSESMMVSSRWAMVKTVQSRNLVRIRSWINASVLGSTLAVASSRTRMLFCLYIYYMSASFVVSTNTFVRSKRSPT